MKYETIDRIRKFTEDRNSDELNKTANLAKPSVIEEKKILQQIQWQD